MVLHPCSGPSQRPGFPAKAEAGKPESERGMAPVHYHKRGVDRVFIVHPLFLEKVWEKTGGKLYGPVTGEDYEDNQIRFSWLECCHFIKLLFINTCLVLSSPSRCMVRSFGKMTVHINQWQQVRSCTVCVPGPSKRAGLFSHSGAKTAWDMFSEERSMRHITTFSENLDAILGGGIHCSEVTEVGGAPGVGKTQLGVQIPVDCGGLGGKAVYIDTEGSFMVERAHQIAEACIRDTLDKFIQRMDLQACQEKMQPNNFLSNIFYFRICSYTDYLQGNKLTGPIPPELGNMTKLHYLELNDNQLSGHIPPELGKLTDLFDLNLANNNLEGPIPENLSSCVNLNSLNVHGNRLNGSIPRVFEKLESMTYLHPNISSQSGAICLDILKDQWSPALSLKTTLLSLHALLAAPEPDDPQDDVVAQQYLRDYPTFVSIARYWTEAFAKCINIRTEEKAQRLVEMGFPEDLVRTTLEAVGGDENMALEKLYSG